MASQIGAQMFTLREFTRTPDAIASTLEKVKQIGYDAVQASAMGPIEPEALRKILDQNELICCATHVPWDRLVGELDQVIDEHKTIGCDYIALGSMPGKAFPHNAEGFTEFAGAASDVAAKLKEAGITFGYHNHAFEFERFNGKPGLQILKELGSEELTFEIDTYWVAAGGADPAAWIAGLEGRVPVIHVKDMVWGVDQTGLDRMTRGEAESDETFEMRRSMASNKRAIMAEVGEGNLNWSAILDACKSAGVQWYVVEQDVCQRDPFESLAISLNNLKSWGLN